MYIYRLTVFTRSRVLCIVVTAVVYWALSSPTLFGFVRSSTGVSRSGACRFQLEFCVRLLRHF